MHECDWRRRASTSRASPEVLVRLSHCQPDGMLVRNLAALAFFRQTDLPTVADVSLNAVNEVGGAMAPCGGCRTSDAWLRPER